MIIIKNSKLLAYSIGLYKNIIHRYDKKRNKPISLTLFPIKLNTNSIDNNKNMIAFDSPNKLNFTKLTFL